MSGRVSYENGRAAEARVAAHYASDGYAILARRWRGKAGEIDLVVERDGEVVFVEVKASSSLTKAAIALTERQIRRIYASAAQFIGFLPTGQETPSRFDVALVDGTGRLELLPNAIMP
ncbi:hypothetical protein HKCCE3408_01680 [Rhodobacterales bacterium HKCCE3408]|nr:hypothetical protein [Rhodobacterales bacterium HKCCE3408]